MTVRNLVASSGAVLYRLPSVFAAHRHVFVDDDDDHNNYSHNTYSPALRQHTANQPYFLVFRNTPLHLVVRDTSVRITSLQMSHLRRRR